jgi:O-acetyl-ADP-ribose deacetylase
MQPLSQQLGETGTWALLGAAGTGLLAFTAGRAYLNWSTVDALAAALLGAVGGALGSVLTRSGTIDSTNGKPELQPPADLAAIVRGKTRFVLRKGDITQERCDAIVNAANNKLACGGGVDAAIHKAAGPKLQEECNKFPVDMNKVRCPVGEARVAGAHALEPTIKWIVLTVGPEWNAKAADEGKRLLHAAYTSSLQAAADKGARTIAFPSISTGIFHFPIELAPSIVLDAIGAYVDEHPDAFDEIRLDVLSRRDIDAYRKEMETRVKATDSGWALADPSVIAKGPIPITMEKEQVV